uniref:histidine kinase n=1 Tax=uncultured Helicobacter sp. TaxID=175537 RepID=A0A650EJJ3_9HELI|nr:hypothetical protein Helico4rc_0190 [uncultured Helicobacter sp.]
MKNIIHLITKAPFQTQTTVLMWIITLGFLLIGGVGLLALVGLKAEFDTNSPQNQSMSILISLSKTYRANPQDTNKLIEIWDTYKTHSLTENNPSKIRTLRQWYAQSFLPMQRNEIENLLVQENTTTILIDQIFATQNTDQLTYLIDEKIDINLKLAALNKTITDSLYSHTYIILIVFLVILGATLFYFSLTIKHSINNNHLLLERLVDSKTKELQMLNANLQKSIEHEVEQNRQKDLIMFQQARLASMGEMIQNIAHQWRQPLNSLMMLIQSFKTKQLQDKLDTSFVLSQTEYGMKIAQNMSDTIENFRSFFRPDKQKEHFSIICSINDSIDLLKEQLKEQLITLNILNNVDEENLYILGYQNSFTQVILILINNAMDALKRQTENKESIIEISLERIGYNVFIHFKDNAGGVKLEDKTKVFEPYFTTKHQSVGTGIGLYMAKQIIERQMNGTISVENTHWGKENQYFGAEFTIKIPLQKDHTDES